MTPDCHCVLVVEDDPGICKRLVECVESLGMRSRTAATLQEVDQAIVEGGFCCVLLDKQIPATPTSPPLTATGDTALQRLRAFEPRRNTSDHHILPILVVTGVSQTDAFINDNYRRGATAFIAKPVVPDRIAAEVAAALERAGRREHRECLGLSAPTPAAGEEETFLLALDGLRVGRRTSFVLNGKRCDLQDGLFVVLLRLGALRARGSIQGKSKSDLGVLRSPEILTRIRDAVESALPPDFSFIQRMDGGTYRLHPLVTVSPIDWKAFERHPHAGVSALAAAERKLR